MRTFRVSDELFHGFEVAVDLDWHDSNDEVCKYIQQNLVEFLDAHSLAFLSEKAKALHFHIHDNEFGSILISDATTIFWVCSHCMETAQAASALPEPSAPAASLN